jgi:N-acetylglucosaminyldiphosphoundecaprenol N-acetyl-beta-D-mannosaminyltransferase
MIGKQSSSPANTRQTPVYRKHNILKVPFDLVDYCTVMSTIVQCRRNGERIYVTLTPPHSVLMCCRDVELRQATVKADLTLPDGVGVILAAVLLGYHHRGRVTGPTLMLRLCDWGREKRLKHFFYGGVPGIADELVNRLSVQFPGLQVAGAYTPPFRQLTSAEDDEIVEHINNCAPDIVWVGLGSPKQERWMAEHLERIKATAMIGVGAAFDFHSGKVKWCPNWIRRLGLEWVYRTLQEPRRIGPKALDNLVFGIQVLEICVKRKLGIGK